MSKRPLHHLTFLPPLPLSAWGEEEAVRLSIFFCMRAWHMDVRALLSVSTPESNFSRLN